MRTAVTIIGVKCADSGVFSTSFFFQGGGVGKEVKLFFKITTRYSSTDIEKNSYWSIGKQIAYYNFKL